MTVPRPGGYNVDMVYEYEASPILGSSYSGERNGTEVKTRLIGFLHEYPSPSRRRPPELE